jgi:hypothetical protein
VAKKFSLTNFAEVVWGKRAEGLPIPEFDLANKLTQQEINNLQRRFAYVQLLDPDRAEEFGEVRLIRAKSGWVILDYGSAMASSAGEKIFSQGEYTRNEGGVLTQIPTGKGTIVMQIIDTAADMVRLAAEKGWPLIHIVDGHPFMSWAIWKACQDLGLPMTGFMPSIEEEARYRRIKRRCPNTLLLQEKSLGAKF